jgi:hypothetical protein
MCLLASTSTKESLNRDGDQFHRYQQNEHSSFTIAELTEHNNKQTTTYHVENPGQAHICGGVKPVNGTPRKYVIILVISFPPGARVAQ